jgi:hypothetical protein
MSRRLVSVELNNAIKLYIRRVFLSSWFILTESCSRNHLEIYVINFLKFICNASLNTVKNAQCFQAYIVICNNVLQSEDINTLSF